MAIPFLLLEEPSSIPTAVSQVTYTVIKINTRTPICFFCIKGATTITLNKQIQVVFFSSL